MLRLPAVVHQTRPWRQQQRAGTRADRMFTQFEVTIPQPIAALRLAIPGDIADSLEAAALAIARLDAAHGTVLSALAGLLLRTESVASSKIEHISASVDDYARALHGSRANASAVSMVAASRATGTLLDAVTEARGIQLEDILAAHRTLMADEVGEEAHAGRVRDVQNWVGGSDYSPRGALFVPPPPDLLEEGLADLMGFANRGDLPTLLQATIAHAQFETLHPFTDGNGRIGRALVNAILRARGTTSRIVVPIASGLVARRDAYFAALDDFRGGDLEPIVRLFASAALIAAQESEVTAVLVGELPDEWAADLGRTRSGSAPMLLLEHLLVTPAIGAADVETILGSGSSVAYAAIDRLESAGIIRPLTDRKRNQVWGVGALLDELADLDRRIQARARSASSMS